LRHLFYLLLIPFSTYVGPLGALTLFPALWGTYHWLSTEAYLGVGKDGRLYSFLVTLALGALTYTNPWCLIGLTAFVAYWARLCL